MDVCAPVVADEQPFELVEPGEGALDDPAVAAQAGAVLGLAPRDLGRDAALAELAAMAVVVVAAIGAEPFGAAARPSYRSVRLSTEVSSADRRLIVRSGSTGSRRSHLAI